MAGQYNRINGAYCKVKKRYDRISGAWTPVKKRWNKVNGMWVPGYIGSVPITFSNYEEHNLLYTPTFTPTISGQVYKLTVSALSQYQPGGAGAAFIVNISEPSFAGKPLLYIPEIYLHFNNISGYNYDFCIQVDNETNDERETYDAVITDKATVIPARTITLGSSITGPFKLYLYFASVYYSDGSLMNWFKLDNTSFQIDFSKVMWLPTNTNCELQ